MTKMLLPNDVFKPDLLAGKRFIVTGGGSGLGKEMSQGFASLGADVVIASRRGELLEQTAAELNGREDVIGTIEPKVLDIRGADDVQQFVNEVFESGPVSGLVNNAAGNFISRTKDLTPKGFDAIANIVFHGTFYLTSACGRKWIEAGQSASVLSILTTWVWTGAPFTVPSAMSKSAINTMTKSLAVEWGPENIRFNAIAPGPFPTEGAWARLSPKSDGVKASEKGEGKLPGNPMGRVGEMSELQNLAIFLMSDASQYLNGQTIAIDGAAYLKTNGGFQDLENLTDEQWDNIRQTIRKSNDKDKSQRTS